MIEMKRLLSFRGSAALFAAKLCFAVGRDKRFAAVPPASIADKSGGVLMHSTEKHSFSANRAAEPLTRRAAPILFEFLLVLIFFTAATGQTPTPTPDEPMPVPPSFNKPLPPLPDASRIGVQAGDEVSLTLDQAIEMALRNNNDIDVSRNDVRIAEFNLKAAKGIYDPLFNSQSFFEKAAPPRRHRRWAALLTTR
jgi:hypothetical protein